MSETLAMTRLMWRQSLTVFCFVAPVAILGMILAFSLQSWLLESSLGILTLSFAPITVWVLISFEIDNKADFMSGESCYGAWMLRLPIETWKLALVPNLIRVTLITLLWCSFAAAANVILGVSKLAYVVPSLTFSALAVWIATIGWRPSRFKWLRMGWLPVFLFALWASVIVTVIASDTRDFADAKYAPLRKLALASGPTLLILGLMASIRSVRLARSHYGGITPANVNRWNDSLRSSSRGDRLRQHGGVVHALVWYDLSRSKFRNIVFASGILLVATIISLTIKNTIAALPVMIMMFGYFTSMVAQVIFEPQSKKNVTSLPQHFAIAPIGTATIAWTRASIAASLTTAMLLVLLLPIYITWMRPSLQNLWDNWAVEMANQYGTPDAGYRIAAALVLTVFVGIIGRSVTTLWASMTGNPRFYLYVSIVGPLGVFAPLCIVPLWFLQQTTYESAVANAWWWAAYLEPLAIVLLVLKAIAISVAISKLLRSDLVKNKTVWRIAASWALVVVSVSTLISWLVPAPEVATWWCFALIALLIPLARVLVLPLSVNYDRHR